MESIEQAVKQYLRACEFQKNLDAKTVKAYRIDLRQFTEYLTEQNAEIDRETVKSYIMYLNQRYKPRSVKRKIASLKALCTYLEDEELLEVNPFARLKIKLQEPFILPRTIPLRVIERMLAAAYHELRCGEPEQTRRKALRNAAVMELLFATGMRVSELCGLNTDDVDLVDGTVRIFGKGAKERILQITNVEVLSVLRSYTQVFKPIERGAFFLNQRKTRLSEQSVRLMLRKYADQVGTPLHITPHMYRHSFATLLLEEDVDIRYIQQLLGHSSISTTQIYTHVATAKQRDILSLKHPRNRISV